MEEFPCNQCECWRIYVTAESIFTTTLTQQIKSNVMIIEENQRICVPRYWNLIQIEWVEGNFNVFIVCGKIDFLIIWFLWEEKLMNQFQLTLIILRANWLVWQVFTLKSKTYATTTTNKIPWSFTRCYLQATKSTSFHVVFVGKKDVSHFWWKRKKIIVCSCVCLSMGV